MTTAFDYCIEEDDVTASSDCKKGRLVPRGTGAGEWGGAFVAIDADTPDGEIRREDILGIDLEHMLFYADHASHEPAPAKPTAKDLVKINGLTAFAYDEGYAYERGYHLLTVNAAWEAATLESRECDWRGLCVHWMAENQDQSDLEFQRCTERFPENPTCSAFANEDANEPESSRECRDRYQSTADRQACIPTSSEPMLVDSPDGLSTSLTIQLGMGLLDARW